MERTPTDSQYLSTCLIGNLCSSNSESNSVFQLPQDLIIEVLLHLPVKPLVKFKCVSKPWFSLISSPRFIKSQFSTSSRDGQYFNHQLLFTTMAPTSGMKQCSLSSALHEPSSTHVSDIEYPTQNPKMSLRIVGIVNGLVCLAIGTNDLYLWNPVLRNSKRLPSSKSSLRGCSFVAYGFGYDESNDDYKVVKAPCVYRGGVYETKVKVYSLRADSWRMIEDFKAGVPSYDTGKYTNGKILWTVNRISGSSEKWKIVSLDMVSEKFEEVQGPDYEAGVHDWRIGVLCGRRFSVLCDYYRRKADLWVMDKYGVEESWSKIVSIPYNGVYPLKPYKQVVCISRNGEIVLEDRWGLLAYRSTEKEFRNIQIHGCSSFSEVFVYVESLVSPNGL